MEKRPWKLKAALVLTSIMAGALCWLALLPHVYAKEGSALAAALFGAGLVAVSIFSRVPEYVYIYSDWAAKHYYRPVPPFNLKRDKFSIVEVLLVLGIMLATYFSLFYGVTGVDRGGVESNKLQWALLGTVLAVTMYWLIDELIVILRKRARDLSA